MEGQPLAKPSAGGTGRFPRFRDDVSKPGIDLPLGSWDTAAHIYADPLLFPYAKDGERLGPAPEATMGRLLRLHNRLGIERGVVVQSLSYGTDPRVMLAGLAEAAGRYVGVTLLEPGTSDSTIVDLTEAGVRGARFNLPSWLAAPMDDRTLAREIARLGEAGWSAAIHVDVNVLIERETLFASIDDTQVVIDHMAHFTVDLGYDHPAMAVLGRLLAKDNFWIRLSNADRCSRMDDGYQDSVELLRRMFALAPDRSVWGTDWPHPFYTKPIMVDDGVLPGLLAVALPDPADLHRVLVANPGRLYSGTDGPSGNGHG